MLAECLVLMPKLRAYSTHSRVNVATEEEDAASAVEQDMDDEVN